MPGRAADVSAASRVTTTPEARATTTERLGTLMQKAMEGTLTPAEGAELLALLKSPETEGMFSPAQERDVRGFLKDGQLPLRSVRTLAAELKNAEPHQLADHFATNLALMKPLLMGPKTLNRAQRAQRLFELMVPYVKAALAKATTPAQLKSVATQLLAQASKAGFKELIQRGTTGHTGLDALKQLLEAKTPGDVQKQAKELKFDAPSWPNESPVKSREGERDWGARTPGQIAAPQQQPVVQPAGQQGTRRHDEADTPEAAERHRRGKLGAQMLWNVMHLFRSDGREDRESAAQREQAARIAVVGGLILVLVAIIVAVAVAL